MKDLSGGENQLYKCIFEVTAIRMQTHREILARQGPESPMQDTRVGQKLKGKLLGRPWEINFQLLGEKRDEKF